MDSPSGAVFETVNVEKRYGPLAAVDRVTLSIHSGEIYGLVGPSGAGKTTLIRMLSGLTSPSTGTVRLLGCRMPRQRRAVDGRFGYMPQERAVYRDLTVGENLLFFGQIYGMRRRRILEESQRLLTMMRLDDRAGQRADRLSGGERQRLSLACALIHDPEALLLDEPTIGLDPALRAEFWDYFRRLGEAGHTILLSTHYLHEAERCVRVGLVQRGRLVAEGTPDQLRSQAAVASGREVEDMEEVFLVLTGAAGGGKR